MGRLLDKIFPHWGKEIHEDTFLQTDAAVLYPVLLEKSVALDNFPFVIADGKTEAAFAYIGYLCMGMAVKGPYGAFLKIVFYAHHSIAVGQYLAYYPMCNVLAFNIPAEYPSRIFMLFAHIFNTC
jgi:hypothetical protein